MLVSLPTRISVTRPQWVKQTDINEFMFYIVIRHFYILIVMPLTHYIAHTIWSISCRLYILHFARFIYIDFWVVLLGLYNRLQCDSLSCFIQCPFIATFFASAEEALVKNMGKTYYTADFSQEIKLQTLSLIVLHEHSCNNTGLWGRCRLILHVNACQWRIRSDIWASKTFFKSIKPILIFLGCSRI